MEYADASDSKVLPAKNYSIVDTEYDWMKDSVTVMDENFAGNEIVGILFPHPIKYQII